MKREFKFRCWDKDIKAWVWNPSYGLKQNITDNGTQIFMDMSQPDNLIIEQFTGLKDKNGKDIYEGHIVRAYIESGLLSYDVETIHGKVIYNEDLCMYQVENSMLASLSDCEIIGNIHENPELLK